MKLERWARYLEVSSNVAVLVVAMVLLGAIVSTRWWPRTGNAHFGDGLQRGQVLARLPSVDYGEATQTMLLFLSTKCNYCQESLPFYKRLLDELHQGGPRTRMVAVFPNPTNEVEQYERQNQLGIEAVTALNYGTFNVTGTPTLILVDSSGRILDFWVGKLSRDEEAQLMNAIRPR